MSRGQVRRPLSSSWINGLAGNEGRSILSGCPEGATKRRSALLACQRKRSSSRTAPSGVSVSGLVVGGRAPLRARTAFRPSASLPNAPCAAHATAFTHKQLWGLRPPLPNRALRDQRGGLALDQTLVRRPRGTRVLLLTRTLRLLGPEPPLCIPLFVQLDRGSQIGSRPCRPRPDR